MFNPTLIERILHKIDSKTMPLLAKRRRNRLNNTDFTIIANNCWGGVCYEYFGLQKNSPTVGTFLMAKDYLKFVGNLREYVKKDLKFIDVSESKYKDIWIKDPKMTNVPIGILGDVEIVFLHYKSKEIVLDKWNRRVKRINWDNLIFKFSFMNECEEADLVAFDEMELPGKKIMFVNDRTAIGKCGCYYPGFDEERQITNDTYYWDKYINVYKFINEGLIEPRI